MHEGDCGNIHCSNIDCGNIARSNIDCTNIDCANIDCGPLHFHHLHCCIGWDFPHRILEAFCQGGGDPGIYYTTFPDRSTESATTAENNRDSEERQGLISEQPRWEPPPAYQSKSTSTTVEPPKLTVAAAAVRPAISGEAEEPSGSSTKRISTPPAEIDFKVWV